LQNVRTPPTNPNQPPMNYTPEHITDLPPGGVFVFGSNLAGNHAGGAARTAVELFGAIEGKPEGIQGRSYAFPTLDENHRKVPIKLGKVFGLETYRDNFYRYAIHHPELTFYLTPVGLGIAGYDISEIAPLFKVILSNIIYPKIIIDYNAR